MAGKQLTVISYVLRNGEKTKLGELPEKDYRILTDRLNDAAMEAAGYVKAIAKKKVV